MKVNIELIIFFALLVVIVGTFLVAQETNSITGAAISTISLEVQQIDLQNIPSITLVLNTTNLSSNNTDTNLTAYNTTQINGTSLKVIYNWLRNDNPIAVVNMPFEEINGTPYNNTWDYSGKGNHGNESSDGGLVWNATDGYDGKGAYYFNRSDLPFIELPNNPALKNICFDGCTFTAWIKKSGTEAGGNNVILGRWNNTDAGDFFRVISSGEDGGALFLEFYQGGTAAASCDASGGGIGLNNWVFISARYNRTHTSVFINGTQKTAAACSFSSINATAWATDQKVTIGATSAPGNRQSWNGTIDEVMIFNRSLSAEQIFALYQNKTKVIVAQETSRGENWTIVGTPNNGTGDGTVVSSNNVTILNTKPILGSLILNTTNMSSNSSDVNLTAYANASDIDNSSVKIIYNWLRNDTTITVLNMPFEGINNTNGNKAWDYSGKGQNGSEQGGIEWNLTGGYDGRGAYRFTGSDTYISGTGIENVGTNGSVTLSIWIQPLSLIGTQTVFSKGQSGVCFNYGLSIRNEGFRSLNSNGDFSMGTGIAVDVWRHLVIVYNNSGAFGYLDGLQVGSDALGGTTDCASLTWTIGVHAQNDLIRDFNGHIDDFTIFNRSLSPEQIFALWQNKTNIIVAQETLGRENWSVQATPNDGFEDGTMVTSNNVTIFDRIAPNVNITNPANGSSFSAITTFFNATVIDAESDISTVLFMFNTNATPFNKTASNTSGNWNVSVNLSAFSEGLHSVIVFANDSANNTNQSVNISFTVDKTPPTVVFTAPVAGATLAGIHSFNATINDNITAVQTVIFQFSDGTTPFNRTASNNSGTWNVSVDTTIITEGALTITLFANDTAGNTNNTQTLSLTIDNVAEVGAGAGGGGSSGGSTSTPSAEYICGNGILENGEQCDSGEGCVSSCECGDGYKSVKKINCEKLPYCGDGLVNRLTEQCDISDLNGQTCSLVGYANGELECTSQCTFDVSKCQSPKEDIKESETSKGKEALITSLVKNSAFVGNAIGKASTYIKNYTIYWFLSIVIILFLLIGLYLRNQPLPEFLWKMKPVPQVKIEQTPIIIIPPTMIEKKDVHLRNWGSKNYINLQQELKNIEALIKETPLPEQKSKVLKLTSLGTIKTKQKKLSETPLTQYSSIKKQKLSFKEVEQWITHLFASGTPIHKVTTIVKGATLLSEAEVKTALIRVRARHLLERKYSLNQKAITKLQNFIRAERKKGATREQVIVDLVKEGWDEGIMRLYVSAHYN